MDDKTDSRDDVSSDGNVDGAAHDSQDHDTDRASTSGQSEGTSETVGENTSPISPSSARWADLDEEEEEEYLSNQLQQIKKANASWRPQSWPNTPAIRSAQNPGSPDKVSAAASTDPDDDDIVASGADNPKTELRVTLANDSAAKSLEEPHKSPRYGQTVFDLETPRITPGSSIIAANVDPKVAEERRRNSMEISQRIFMKNNDAGEGKSKVRSWAPTPSRLSKCATPDDPDSPVSPIDQDLFADFDGVHLEYYSSATTDEDEPVSPVEEDESTDDGIAKQDSRGEIPERPGTPVHNRSSDEAPRNDFTTMFPSAVPSSDTSDEATAAFSSSNTSKQDLDFSFLPDRREFFQPRRKHVRSADGATYTLNLKRSIMIEKMRKRGQSSPELFKKDDPWFRLKIKEQEVEDLGEHIMHTENDLAFAEKQVRERTGQIEDLQKRLKFYKEKIDLLQGAKELRSTSKGTQTVDDVLETTIHSSPSISSWDSSSDSGSDTDSDSEDESLMRSEAPDTAPPVNAPETAHAATQTESSDLWVAAQRDRLVDFFLEYLVKVRQEHGEGMGRTPAREDVEAVLSTTYTFSGFCQSLLNAGMMFKPYLLAEALIDADIAIEDELENFKGLGRIGGNAAARRREIQDLRKQLQEQVDALEELREQCENELAIQQVSSKNELENLAEQLNECHAHGEVLEKEKRETSAQLLTASDDIHRLLARIEALQKALDAESAKCKELLAGTEEVKKQLAEKERLISQKVDELCATEDAYEALRKEVKELKNSLADEKKRGNEDDDASPTRRMLLQAREEVERLRNENESFRSAHADLTDEMNHICQDKNALLEMSENAQKREEALQAHNKDLQAELNSLRRRWAELTEEQMQSIQSRGRTAQPGDSPFTLNTSTKSRNDAEKEKARRRKEIMARQQVEARKWEEEYNKRKEIREEFWSQELGWTKHPAKPRHSRWDGLPLAPPVRKVRFA